MILGYKKLKQCTGGQLVRFASGTWALLSEYYAPNSDVPKGYIVGTGEALHCDNPDEWVLVIDTDDLEESLLVNEGVDYPNDSGA